MARDDSRFIRYRGAHPGTWITGVVIVLGVLAWWFIAP